MRFSTIGLRGIGLLLVAVSASLAAGPVAFEKHVLTEKDQFYHGTGVGDINGDGRNDLILYDGWWEQPANGSDQTEWTAHPFRFAKRGGAQVYAYDVDGDGDNDVITALDAHGWGLAWFEQVRRDGQITFIQHTISSPRIAADTCFVRASPALHRGSSAHAPHMRCEKPSTENTLRRRPPTSPGSSCAHPSRPTGRNRRRPWRWGVRCPEDRPR